MSTETKTALDDAIAAHIADEAEGAIVTGYTLIVSNVTAEDLNNEAHGYWCEYPDHQAFHVSLGLVERQRLVLHNQSRIGYDEDDD